MRIGILLSAFLLSITASVVHAQLDFATPASIVAIPQQPAPRQEVALEFKSSFLDINRADIEWFVDNESAAQGIGLTKVKIHAGELGSVRTITAVATDLEGIATRAEITLRPVMVDLVWEAESFTPPTYRGRKLPTSGTFIRAEANAFFLRPDGTPIPRTELIYTWKRDGAVLGSVSGAGKYAARIATPTFLGESILSVEVSSRDKTFFGTALSRIPATEPYMVLYQDDPLRGIMLNNALKRRSTITEAEVTLTAVPFFSSVSKLSDPELTFSWKINDRSAPTDPVDPSRLTISQGNSPTTHARINISSAHKTALFQESEGNWVIEFGQSDTELSNNPFTSGN